MQFRIDSMSRLVMATLLGVTCIGSGTALAQQKARLGHAMPTEHPQAKTMDKFAELAGKYTEGRVQIQVYPGGVLGGDDKMLQATQAGTQEIYYGAVSPIAGRVKPLQAFDFPFLFNNYDEVDYVFRGAMGQKLFDMMRPLNVVGLAWGEAGFRQLSNSKRAIKRVEDLGGLKIRVMQNPVALETWKAMGTNAVPMSYAEVFTALETKALDGQENPLIHMYANKMYEVQKYITVTNHVYTPCAILVSTKYWNALAPKDQEALKKAATESMVFHRQIMTAADQDVIAKLRQHGVSVEPLPPSELTKLREKVKPVIDKFTPEVGSEFVASFFAEIEKARKQAK
ncbi:MAG: TRAP transporter substrate-binding protein [Rhodocyclaceae bacterium]